MELTREHLLNEIREYLQTQRSIEPARVREDAQLRDDLGLDSLDLAELGMQWAGDYGVMLDEEAILHLETVGEAIDFVIDSAGVTAEG